MRDTFSLLIQHQTAKSDRNCLDSKLVLSRRLLFGRGVLSVNQMRNWSPNRASDGKILNWKHFRRSRRLLVGTPGDQGGSKNGRESVTVARPKKTVSSSYNLKLGFETWTWNLDFETWIWNLKLEIHFWDIPVARPKKMVSSSWNLKLELETWTSFIWN